MLIVENCIVSEDIADCQFACDLCQCKGACCVEGDSGAPLEQEEITLLEELYPHVKPYMTPEGVRAVEQQGVAVQDKEGDWGTPLINNRDCAFVCHDNGMTYCAIEKAFRDGKINFLKPVSCHLYPIRIEHFREFTAVNYHQWDICHCARQKGHQEQTCLYQYLKEPLIRKFGESWYAQLEKVCQEFLSNKTR